MKVLVVPDVHLKRRIFDEAEKAIVYLEEREEELPESERQQIGAVCLGDWADDWGKQNDLQAYRDTFDRGIAFLTQHTNTYFCIGNHDISYVWQKEESGFSYNPDVQFMVRKKMKELERALVDEGHFAFIHCIDNTIFSHAGIGRGYIKEYAGFGGDLDNFIWRINNTFGEAELWKDRSPIWARLQKEWYQNDSPYSGRRLQVVGHTPVEKAIYDAEDYLLSVDTFSTDENGNPLGEQRFVVVDTVKMTYTYVDFDD